MKPAIYLITGVMASGKSTVSELLSQKFEKGVHLRGDVFRRMMTAGREEMSSQPSEEAIRQLELRYQLSADAAMRYVDHGFSVVLQDNYYGEMLPLMLALLEDYPVHLVVLCPSVAAVKQREQQRSKTGYHGFEVEALYHSFLQETPRIGFWLDSSLQTPEETAQAIFAQFHSAETE